MIAVSVREDDRTQGWIFDAKPGHRREKIVGRAVGIQRKAKVEQDSLARGLELDAGATNLLRSAVDTSAKRTGCFGHQRLVLAAEPGSAVTCDQAMAFLAEGRALRDGRGNFKANTAPGNDLSIFKRAPEKLRLFEKKMSVLFRRNITCW
ncbi:hypothetical protein [Bradyrhizobium sp. LA6.12]|uniref:hypothetical protein n=1 Tax=unclassified Bradyrhizobium TaxID=2631580 RepID=UPI003397A363